MQERGFIDLHPDAAPPAARALLEATRRKLGFVPSAMARMAHAPSLATAFQRAIAAFEATSLTAIEREVAVLAMAREIECEVCDAMHARILGALGGTSHVEAIRAGTPLHDARLDAIVEMTRAILDHRGDVDAARWSRFLAAGYTRAQALELLIGVGAYTMSTYANRLTEAGVDPELRL